MLRNEFWAEQRQAEQQVIKRLTDLVARNPWPPNEQKIDPRVTAIETAQWRLCVFAELDPSE